MTMRSRQAKAAARAARTQSLLRQQRIARFAMARRPKAARDVTNFHAVMAMLDRGATDDEIVDAVAALASLPDSKQGMLL